MPSKLLTPDVEANLARTIVQRSTSDMPLTKAGVLEEARIRRARQQKCS